MTIEKQVTSLEISKRLKELGCKKENLFVWYLPSDGGDLRIGKWNEVSPANLVEKNSPVFAAHTVAELGEMLPDVIRETSKLTGKTVTKDVIIGFTDDWDFGKRFYWCEMGEPHPSFSEETEADARGKMLIYLLENGLCQV